MNQTELNAYKAMLEAKQAELAEALRHSEEVDRRGDSPATRVNLYLPESAYEDLEAILRHGHGHQSESAIYTVAVLREIRAMYKACGGPWALVYSILAMGASYLMLWSSKHFYLKLAILLILAVLMFVWMIHGAPPGHQKRRRPGRKVFVGTSRFVVAEI